VVVHGTHEPGESIRYFFGASGAPLRAFLNPYSGQRQCYPMDLSISCRRAIVMRLVGHFFCGWQSGECPHHGTTATGCSQNSMPKKKQIRLWS
jgi:hypothetical protein